MRIGQRPDILLITVDTLRRDALAPYGADLLPRVSELLGEAAAFDACHATAPWTGPSFGSAFTGLWPARHGCAANTPRLGAGPVRRPLRRDVTTLAEVLRGAGWRTLASQGNVGYLGPGSGFARGFDEYAVWAGDHFGPGGSTGRLAVERTAWRHAGSRMYGRYVAARLGQVVRRRRLPRRCPMQSAQAVASAAVRMLRRAGGDRPVFLWANFIDPHCPTCAPRGYMPRHEAPGRVRPCHLSPGQHLDDEMTADDIAYARRRYDNATRYAGEWIGKLLDAHRRLRGRDRLLTFFSDHGEEFGEHGRWRQDPLYYTRGVQHGHTLYGELLRVPWFIHWPGGGVQAGRCDVLASLVDFTPTLLDLLEIDSPCASADGVSLGAAARGAGPACGGDRVVFADSILFGRQRQAAISATHKLIHCPPTDEMELYAWGAGDGGEKCDQAGQPAAGGVQAELMGRLVDWRARMPEEAFGPDLDEREAAALDERLRALGYM